MKNTRKPKIKKTYILFLFAFIFLFPGIIYSFIINPYNNYKTASTIDNSSSIFYNPAGLALTQDFNIYFNLSSIHSKIRNTSLAFSFFLGGLGYENFEIEDKEYDIYHLAVPGYFNFFGQTVYFGLANKWYTINKSQPYTFGLSFLTRFFNHVALGFVYDNLNKKNIHYNNNDSTIKKTSLGLGFFRNRVMLSLDNIALGKFYYDNNIYQASLEPVSGLLLNLTYFDLKDEKKLFAGVKIKFPHFGIEYYNSDKYSKNHNFELSYHAKTYKTFFSIGGQVTEIKISGLLTDSEQFSFFGITSSGAQRILENLNKCLDDDSIKGVILNIGSIATTSYGGIGGLVYEICEKIIQLKSRGKYIVAYLETGGSTEEYYLASAANKIVFSSFAALSELGISIKVLKLKGLLDKIGISFEVIQSGQDKNSLNPFTKEIDSEQEEKIKNSVEDSFDLFVKSVSGQRLINIKDIKNLIEEQPVLDTETLIKNHWIDSVGYKEKAYEVMAKLLNKSKVYGFLETDVNRIEYLKKDWKESPIVAIVNIYGPIMSGESIFNPLFGNLATGSDTIANQLKEIQGNKSIKAVILRIDSPGGTIVASDRIYEAVLKLKESGKYIIASFGGIATSGSYYIACAADKIISTPFTITGSIGVFTMKLELSGLMKEFDVTSKTIKKGKYSDLFSWDRKLTEDEREKLFKTMNKAHNRFKDIVKKSRKLDDQSLDTVTSGAVYTGNQAKEMKLVDELGGIRKAVEHIEKELDIDRPILIYYWKNIKSYKPIRLGTYIFSF